MTTVPLDDRHGHRATLNFADGFSDGLARALEALQWFKGDDIATTDVQPALTN